MATLPDIFPECTIPLFVKEPIIEIKDLYKSFGSKEVLKGISLNLYSGENLVVLGKSGCGKSVLIKCIAGLIRPDSGSIRVFGQEITSLTHDQLDSVRSRIGFLFQSGALYDSMTVRKNLEFPMRRSRVVLSQKEIDLLVGEVLEDVGLSYAIDLSPSELSGGMKKRIGIARMLICKPEVILYDEPTTGLDLVTARGINDLILSVQKRYKAASIIITHDMACVKATANRIILLANGICHAEGTYTNLQDSTDLTVKEFFG